MKKSKTKYRDLATCGPAAVYPIQDSIIINPFKLAVVVLRNGGQFWKGLIFSKESVENPYILTKTIKRILFSNWVAEIVQIEISFRR